MNYWLVIKDIATIRSNSRRFFLAVTLFIFHKFTGTDSLNYFAPEIFEMIGVKGGSLPLLTTGVYGLVKFATTIIYVTVLVDRIGRRRPLLVWTVARTLGSSSRNAADSSTIRSVLPCKPQPCSTSLSTSNSQTPITAVARLPVVLLVLSGMRLFFPSSP